MKPDTISKSEMLKILAGNAELKPDKLSELKSGLDYLEQTNGIPELGYTLDVVQCEKCGYIRVSVHPVPMQFPCECDKCGEKSCWVKESKKEEPL